MHTNCEIGGCSNRANRAAEIRRHASDELPAEVRPLCSQPVCELIARQAASDFDVRIARLGSPRAAALRWIAEQVGDEEAARIGAMAAVLDEVL